MSAVSSKKCPICHRPTSYESNPYRPFCSERCKQIDLGAWAAEQYTIPVVEEDDLPEAPGNDASGKLN